MVVLSFSVRVRVSGATWLTPGQSARPIATQFLTHRDHPVLEASTMPIKRLGLLERCMRISKIGSQIALQGGLVAFDHPEGIRLL